MRKLAAKASGAKKVYSPDILAHEMGHAAVHKYVPFMSQVRNVSSGVGRVASVAGTGPLSILGELPTVADEVAASIKASQTLKDAEFTPRQRKAIAKRYAIALATYAVRPTAKAFAYTLGAISKSSIPGRLSPLIADTIETVVNPKLLEVHKGIRAPLVSKSEARALAKEIDPNVKVYFADRPLPDLAYYKGPEKVHAVDIGRWARYMPRDEAKQFVRSGGVVIGPATTSRE